MEWESEVSNQMLSFMCLFKNPQPWMALLALFLVFASYLLVGFGVFSVLYTSLVVVLSTVIYTLSNHKAVQIDKSVEEKVHSSEGERADQREDIASFPMPKIETVTEATESQEEEVKDVVNFSTTSPDLISESEFQDQLSTSEDSEMDWPFRDDVDQSPDCSDGSISDEDSLIEISLPSGHYLGQLKEEPKFYCSLQQSKQELTAESLFSHLSLREFLAEFNDINEEENLIEIDISMGSIKCSRFEIEA